MSWKVGAKQKTAPTKCEIYDFLKKTMVLAYFSCCGFVSDGFLPMG
jgi:hypothetical protein